MITPMQFLLADRFAVEEFIRETPEEDIITRNSWLGRLDSVNEEIAELEKNPAPKRINLIFGGAPINGAQGIPATFGLAALRAYVNAIQIVAAQNGAGESQSTKPDACHFAPLVVSSTFNSFALQEPADAQLTLEGHSAVALALDKTQQLLEATLGSDDELTEAVTDVDARAIRKLRTFLEVLRRNDALCTIESERGMLKFEQPAQIVRSLNRLEARNIHRENVALVGAFSGVLPAARDFEFRRENGEILKGKIARDISEERIAAWNQTLGQPTQVNALSTRVGQGKARFVLVGE